MHLGKESGLMDETTQLLADDRSLCVTELANHPDEWHWVVRLAQSCERLWNERGRGAAKEFARKNIELNVLRHALLHGSELVRTKVLHLMSLWNSPEVLSDLSHALRNDPCPVVRHEAAYFLGLTHELGALEALGFSMLNDCDEIVRHESAEAIGELGLAEGLPWLERAQVDESQLVRRTVEIAQSHIQLSNSDARVELNIYQP
jgi:HEAT repeat protein